MIKYKANLDSAIFLDDRAIFASKTSTQCAEQVRPGPTIQDQDEADK